MTKSTKNKELINSYLESSKDRAINVFENNKLGGAYLACILGMHCYFVGITMSPFSTQYNELTAWFYVGFEASKQSMITNKKINETVLKYEEERAKELKEKKGGFWKMKIF